MQRAILKGTVIHIRESRLHARRRPSSPSASQHLLGRHFSDSRNNTMCPFTGQESYSTLNPAIPYGILQGRVDWEYSYVFKNFINSCTQGSMEKKGKIIKSQGKKSWLKPIWKKTNKQKNRMIFPFSKRPVIINNTNTVEIKFSDHIVLFGAHIQICCL